MNLNRYIDHTLLSPNVMDVAFEEHVKIAVEHNFYSVCVSPHIAGHAVEGLRNYPDTKVCTVVAFPHGNIPLQLKVQQVNYFIDAGVHEIDWVVNPGEILNENWKDISHEMKTLATICSQWNVVSKCIVETGVINSDRLVSKVFELVQEAGVDFIKTSTGFNGAGAQLRHIELWNLLRGKDEYPKIKASGGIKTVEQALGLIAAGADRLGMSASVDVMEQYAKLQGEGNE